MDITLIQGFFVKHLLLPLLIVGLLLILVFFKKRISFVKPKVIFIYVLLCGLILALPGFFGFSGNNFNPYWYLISSILYLFLGVVNINQLRKRFTGNNNPLWVVLGLQLIVTLASMLLGIYVFCYLFNWLSPLEGYALISATSCISYLIPLLFYYTYLSFMDIPFSIYKTWVYDDHKKAPELDGIDFNKLMVINIELTKNVEDGNRFRIKAKTLSTGMTFGDWFQKALEDYNFKNASASIEINNSANEPYAWIFYSKKSFFHFRKYIDFELDITQNKIKENEVIVCKRVEEHKQLH